MQAYQSSMKDSSISALDLRGKHSWDDVLRVAKDAEIVYQRAGGKGLRKAGRFITTKSGAVQPYLRLIPNDSYASILCGGLRLVFEINIAASQIGERRDKVLKTLLRIPKVIAQAEHSVETFPSDPVLYDRAAELYFAVLTAIEGTTRWLLQNPAWKQVRALVLGPHYIKSFKDKIQSLDDALGAMQERISTLRDGAIIRTEKVVESVEMVVNKVGRTGDIVDLTTKATLHHVHGLQSEMEGLNHSANHTSTKVSSITEDIRALTKLQEETHVKMDHLHDMQQAKDEAKRAMMIVLEETTKTSEWMKKKDRVIDRLKRQIAMLERAATSLSRDELLDMLGVSADSSFQDLQRSLRAGQSIELSASHIAKGIIEGKKFREWLSTDNSAALFIEGGLSSASYGLNTPMSLLSSTVIDSLHDKEPAVTIYFFCGSHTSSKDLIRGPHGMMRSLICQILRLFSVELDFISSRLYREQLQSLNLYTLCDCFGKLVKRLPIDTVLVCIIDSICFFEKREWAEDCQKAINDIQDLADEDGLGPVFKLLITSPSRSRYVGGTWPAQCHLLLPADDLSGRGGPTERQNAKGRERDYPRSLRTRSYPCKRREEFSGSFSQSDDASGSDIV
ncbi:hypothetical protein MMC17_008429 [Xylographa soralifera]|nr:hypothetical protein [Xylographa soralifera]